MSENVIDKDHETIPVYSVVCCMCARLRDAKDLQNRTCEAFPDGIPLPIWTGRNDHRLPYAGDNGKQFKERT